LEKLEKLTLNRNFWKNKKVFITGHTGFKGSWLSLWLQDCGAILQGYALGPNTKQNLFDAASICNGMKSMIGDIRNLESLSKSMRNFAPDIVIHMAAQPLVKLSYDDPVKTYSTNVMGTVNVLESVRATSSVKAVVNVTTDKCYKNKEWIWGYREYDEMGGHDPYSNSKGCAELVTSAYRNSFFKYPGAAAIASARAGNIIGGGDWAKDRLIPDIFKSFENKEPVLVRNPSAIRPWQHVLEPISGYLLLAEQLYIHGETYSGGWNFGPNDEDVKPVSYIVEYLTSRWGKGVRWKHDEAKHPQEAILLKLDITKAKNLLKWKPKWSLNQTLDHTVSWQKEYLNGGNIKKITLEQINQFESFKEM
jgi:CDP-glucose 4,6-dehydratase